ncbi:MAG TPA: HD domain-containing protein, partial [Candidatus Brocadiia bacterium]|nr:HD domain-containing protein [Candidatus Brocadiia bacterium]
LAEAVAAAPSLDDASIRKLIHDTVLHNPGVHGSTVALAPEATPLGRYSPYYCRGGQGLRYVSLADPSYDYTRWPWYAEPMRTGRPAWAAPYFDEGAGGVLMTTYSALVARAGARIGVATADIHIDHMASQLAALRVGETGFALIVDSDGHPVASSAGPPEGHPLDRRTLDLGDWAPGASPQANEIEVAGRRMWVLSAPIPSTAWRLAVVYPREEILSPLAALRRGVWLMAAAAAVLAGLLALWASAWASAPVARLAAQTERYRAGRFNEPLDEASGPREIRQLCRALNEMGQSIARSIGELEATRLEIVYHLGRAAEYRDRDTGAHIRRMSHYCALMAEAAGMSEEDCDLMLYASPMHDVGKIGIPDAILLKPGQLTQEEFEAIKAHTLIGERILSESSSSSRLMEMARVIAHTHHEKWNGRGYPRGLKGEQIPLAGRIASLCDVFDSLTSSRPYKAAWTVGQAMEEIERQSGEAFDSRLVVLFKARLGEVIDLMEVFGGDAPPGPGPAPRPKPPFPTRP